MHPLTEKRILAGLSVALAIFLASAILGFHFHEQPHTAFVATLAGGGIELLFLGGLGWLATAELRVRRRREADLQAAEHFSGHLFEAAGDCVAVLSSAGLVLSVNEGSRRRFGLSRADGKASALWADVWKNGQREAAIAAFWIGRVEGGSH